MRLAQVSAAILALRAIGSAVNVILAACLFAICAVRAVVRICYVVCAGACIALLANRAVGSGCNVSRTCNCLVTVHADRAVCRRALVVNAGDCGAALGACGVTNVVVRVSGIGNCLAAVLARRAIVSESSVSIARTNVIAVVAGYVMLIIVEVRRRALKSAICTVTDCIALIIVEVTKSGLAFLSFFVFCRAERADLIENLCVVAIRRRLGYPLAVFVSGRSLVATAIAVANLVARIGVLMIQSLVAESGLFSAANGAVSYLNLSIGAVCFRLGRPVVLKYVRNRSYVIASGNVTSGVAYVIKGMLNGSYVVTVIVVALFIANEGVSMLADGIADLRFLHVTNGAVSRLNLGSEAVCSSFGFPFAKDMLSTGNRRAANPTDQAILFPSLVAGAFSVVTAIVTLKVSNAVVSMRRNALKAATNNITYSIAVVIVLVLDLSGVAAVLAVTYGIAIVIKCMVKSGNVANSGFFSLADIANSVLNLGIQALRGDLGLPFAECMNDNSHVIAILAVTIGVASMVEVVVQRALTGDNVFVAADVAESVKLFSGGTSSRELSLIVFGVAVRDGSLVVALRTVAGNVAIVIEDMAESRFALAGFFLTTETAISCFYFCAVAGSRRLNSPSGKVVNVGTNSLTGVTFCIASIVINVVSNNTGSAANVTIAVACMIVGVSSSNSQLAANVTVCIANGRVNVVGNHSQLAANVTSGVASVGVGVRLGNSGSAANVTGLITSIGISVIGNSERAAEVTVDVAIVVVNVIGSSSFFAANVTVGIAGAIVHMRRNIFANVVTSFALCGASALEGVVGSFSYLAANVAIGVSAVCVGVIALGYAGYEIALVTGGVTGTGIHMVFTEAARKCEEHQHQGQCAEQ